MTVVELNAAQWINAVDFYDGLLSALGAPEWHGRNINALIDSMIYGEINTVEQPFRVEVRGLKCAGPQAIAELHQAIEVLVEEGAHYWIDPDGRASIEVVWPL